MWIRPPTPTGPLLPVPSLVASLVAGLALILGGCDRSIGRMAPEDLPSISSSLEEDSPFALAPIDEAARALVVDRNWPGLSLAVGWRGELVLAHAVGFAALDEPRPLTPEHRIRIGPVTQAVTAAMIAVAAADGLVDLAAPVGRWLPDLPPPYARLTIDDLLRHAAGVRDHRSEDEFISGARRCENRAERLGIFVDDPLVSEPGSAIGHSAYWLVLASAAVEVAAGSDYGALLRRRVLAPLGMGRTDIAPPAGGQVLGDPGGPGQPSELGHAWLYWPFASTDTRYGLEQSSKSDLSCVAPAEGLVSTPSDLVRLGNALLDGTLLAQGLLAALLPPVQSGIDGSVETAGEAGLGFRRQTLRVGDSTVSLYSPPDARGKGWLGPGVPGGTASLVLVPEHGLVIAAATNVTFARELEVFTRGLAAELLDR